MSDFAEVFLVRSDRITVNITLFLDPEIANIRIVFLIFNPV